VEPSDAGAGRYRVSNSIIAAFGECLRNRAAVRRGESQGVEFSNRLRFQQFVFERRKNIEEAPSSGGLRRVDRARFRPLEISCA
jgi:hypothetical protein